MDNERYQEALINALRELKIQMKAITEELKGIKKAIHLK